LGSGSYTASNRSMQIMGMVFRTYGDSSWHDVQSRVKSQFHTFSAGCPTSSTPQLGRVITMATPRRFGQELDQNVRRGPYLSFMQRDQIIGMLQSGATVTEVAYAYGRTDRCIRKIHQKYRQTGTTQDKPRSGRPSVLSLAHKKIIYREVRAAPKIEYSELQQESIFVNHKGTPSKPPSRSTLYRELRRRGLTNHKAKSV
jgi:transposase